MDNSKQSKQVLLSVIGVAILVVAVVGVSFAFFNYTRTGPANSVETGKIWFTSSQSTPLSVENFFPQRPGSTDERNTSSTLVTIQGGTTYTAGMRYRLKAVEVKSNNVAYDPTATGNVPILLDVAVDSTEGGTINTNGVFTPTTGSGTNPAPGVAIPLREGVVLGIGKINGRTGATSTDVDGKIKVTAYIDANVAITDTLVGDSGVPTDYTNGTTTGWVNNRTRLTTSQWNELGEHPVSFRILVESAETGGKYIDGTTAAE